MDIQWGHRLYVTNPYKMSHKSHLFDPRYGLSKEEMTILNKMTF